MHFGGVHGYGTEEHSRQRQPAGRKKLTIGNEPHFGLQANPAV